jgi:hypothetical protein
MMTQGYWNWDEISNEIVRTTRDEAVGINEGWELNDFLPNGVLVFLSDRNHRSLACRAWNEGEAHVKFMEDAEYRKWAEDTGNDGGDEAA